jgi:uncharacterized protein (DUF1501 family)
MPHPVTRRRFLTWTGVGAGTLALGTAGGVSAAQLLTAAREQPLDPAAGVLVVVTLYGGNDGLNTVVPATDPAYQDARPDLAYAPEEVLDLGEGLGLSPGMPGLKGLWDADRLAVVRGVGYPQPDRSHFRSMAVWQTASPEGPTPSGWLGRWLDTVGDPLAALSLDPVLPPLLAGERLAGAALARGRGGLPGGALGESLRLLARPDATDDVWHAAGARAVADMLRADDTFAVPAAGTGEPDDEQRTQGASAGGAGGLEGQLATVAALVELGVPTRVYSVSLGGFDTHSDERGTQEALLADLDRALTGFQQRLDGFERGRQVTTLVYSEFGRRVHANASDGTDHGTAGPVFLLGRGVRGGFHGDQPDLTRLVDGDLVATVDFRDVYASALTGVLGTDPGRVLGGRDHTLDGLLG